MSSYTQTESDLKQHLDEQREFLLQSCKSYDGGALIEAKRISVQLRVLLHDTLKSHSLLSTLNIKHELKFKDSPRKINRDNPFSQSCLTIINASGEEIVSIKHKPRFVIPPFQPDIYDDFDNWWTRTVIIDNNRNEFSRRDIVLYIANKEGGAHIDKELPEVFKALSRDNAFGFKYVNNGQEVDFESIIFPAIRQIAWELNDALDHYYQIL